MNPRAYDLGKQGRSAFNRKLGLKIDERQLTLTAQDLLYATDYLIKVEKGLRNLDDIDHLKNRRVRTSGELIQIQIGIALVRLEKAIRDKINKTSIQFNISDLPKKKLTSEAFPSKFFVSLGKASESTDDFKGETLSQDSAWGSLPGKDFPEQAFPLKSSAESKAFPNETKNLQNLAKSYLNGVKPISLSQDFAWSKQQKSSPTMQNLGSLPLNYPDQKIGGSGGGRSNSGFLTKYNSSYSSLDSKTLTVSNLINNKAFNSALREFFGTSPLSQFMDQINPLSEITHKRRLSSMGPGGVTRDTATLAIRGILPTHYGRICPIETPEGKNTGLVNSMTAYARVNPLGMLESPFYKVYKGIVLKTSGMFFLSAEQEEKTKLAAADLFVTPIGFLPNTNIPVKIGENFTKMDRNNVEYIGVSPIQMISIATSLIPFLEHDDANRALMGSNMQRQAVPLIRPDRPIVGTGLEPRAVSDSGHVIQSKFSGVVTYVSAEKIIVATFKN